MSSWSNLKWPAGLVLLLALFWWPWWLFLIFYIAAVLLLPRFYQSLVIALLFDLIYVISSSAPYGLALPLTLATLILLWLARGLQYHLRS